MGVLVLICTGCPCEEGCPCQDGGLDSGLDGEGGDDGDALQSVQGLGPISRWIGWRSMNTEALDPLENPCPPPTETDPDWRYDRLFSPRKVLAQLGGLDGQGHPNETGREILQVINALGLPDAWHRDLLGDGVFCLYEWLGEPVTEEQSEELMGQIPLIRAFAPDPDPPALVPLATPEELTAGIRGILHDLSLKQLGASGFDLPASAQTPVLVAVMDSAVTDFGDPAVGQGLPGHGRLSHGRDVGLLLRRLTCPGNQPVEDIRAGCRIGLANYLVLDREPDEAGGTRINRAEGGYFGTPGTLAEMIWWAVVMWKVRAPSARLVINMSVGWEEGESYLDRRNHVVRAVRAALVNARCAGALPIVAAGNTNGGPNPGTGPMGPAFFENYDWEGCASVATRDEPMIYSVGGLDGLARPLAGTRSQGRPPLATYAYQVPFDEQYLVPGMPADPVFGSAPLTGTSMSAAAVSGIAAMAWSFGSDRTAGELVELLFGSGIPIGYADYCFGDWCNVGSQIQVRQVSLCRALAAVGAIEANVCPQIPSQNPAWDEAQIADADMIANPIQLPSLTSQQAPSPCGDETRILFDSQGQPPEEICPDLTYTNYISTPQLVPQPRKPICPTCGYIGQQLYIGDELNSPPSPLCLALPGTVDSLRLKLSTANQVVYYDIKDALLPGRWVRVDGIALPPGFIPELAELVAILIGYTGTKITVSEQIPIMP
jgi:hypothetical protein